MIISSAARQYGGMLAFSLFVSLIPLVLGLISLFSLISRNPRRFAGFCQLFVEIFPPDVQGPIREALLAASQHAGTVVVVSVISLVWFSTGHLPRLAALVGVWVTPAALILFIYRSALARRLAPSQLWPGAAGAALLIVLFGYLLMLSTNLTLELSIDTRFFAHVFALAAWVYFIAQATLFGAVLDLSLATRIRTS